MALFATLTEPSAAHHSLPNRDPHAPLPRRAAAPLRRHAPPPPGLLRRQDQLGLPQHPPRRFCYPMRRLRKTKQRRRTDPE